MSFLPVVRAASAVGKVMQFVSKNDLVILTGLSVAGVVATVAATAKAAIETKEILDDIREEEERTGEQVSNLEKAKAVTPKILKSIAAAAFTITCIILAHKKGSEKIAAAVSALTLLQGKYKDVQEENDLLRQRLGREGSDEARQEANRRQLKRQIDSSQTNGAVESDDVIDTGTGDAYFWDKFSGKRFKASKNYVMKALNHLQFRMNSGYYMYNNIPYTEWLEQLGIRGLGGIEWADLVGWKPGTFLELKPDNACVIDDKAYFVLEFRDEPIALA